MRITQVLVIDKSPLVRSLLTDIFNHEADTHLVGAYSKLSAATSKIQQAPPAVIILDIDQPDDEGFKLLTQLINEYALPVIASTTHPRRVGTAMSLGASEVLLRPDMDIKTYYDNMRHHILHLAKSMKAITSPSAPVGEPSKALSQKRPTPAPRPASAITPLPRRVVAIGISAGGQETLPRLLPHFPKNGPPVAIVQHMPGGFTKAFAERLNNMCPMNVQEASNGDLLQPGRILIAPGNFHMKIYSEHDNLCVQVLPGPFVSQHRPSCDVLFRSVAQTLGHNAIGVIMTGMGQDGAQGLKEVLDAGGRTLGQDEESSVVYGMAKAAHAIGAVEELLPLNRLARRILELS